MIGSLSILSNLKVAGALVLDTNHTEFPVDPAIGTMVIKDLALYAYIRVLGVTTWYPLVKAPESYTHSQTSPSAEWIVQHGLNSGDIWYQIQDSNGQLTTPADFQVIDNNSFRLVFSEASQGKVLVLSGGADPSGQGAKGDPGLSAYQIAVANGFVGTEAQWLDSLAAKELAQAMQSLYATFPDVLEAYAGVSRWRPRAEIQIKNIFAELGTAPTTELVVDVLKNGASIFPGEKFKVAVGAVTSTLIVSPAVVVTPNDYLTLSIISGNGADMTLRIDYQIDLIAV